MATSGFLMGLNVEAFIQGVLVTGASVLGYELFKQGKEKH
ncbi:phage holin family protein [Thalassobacillus sp. C254]|nr:phage holin family protein [Thalassobacillus sp. C254]